LEVRRLPGSSRRSFWHLLEMRRNQTRGHQHRVFDHRESGSGRIYSGHRLL